MCVCVRRYTVYLYSTWTTVLLSATPRGCWVWPTTAEVVFSAGVEPPPRSREGDLPFIINCDWWCSGAEGCAPTAEDGCCCCWKAGEVWCKKPALAQYPLVAAFFNSRDPSALNRFNSPGLCSRIKYKKNVYYFSLFHNDIPLHSHKTIVTNNKIYSATSTMVIEEHTTRPAWIMNSRVQSDARQRDEARSADRSFPSVKVDDMPLYIYISTVYIYVIVRPPLFTILTAGLCGNSF